MTQQQHEAILVAVVFAAPVVYGLVFSLVRHRARTAEKQMDANNFVVREGRATLVWSLGFFLAGLACGLAAAFASISLHAAAARLVLVLCLLVLWLLSGLFVWGYIRWRLVVQNGHFTYVPLFGKPQAGRLADIALLREYSYRGPATLRAYNAAGRQLFSCNPTHVGYGLLRRLLEDAGFAVEYSGKRPPKS